MREQLSNNIEAIIKGMIKDGSDMPKFSIVIPDSGAHGDFATNVAMQLAKSLKRNPKSIAEEIAEKVESNFKNELTAEVAGVGFINFTLSDKWFQNTVKEILDDDKFFTNNSGRGKKVMVEFVSANPTGPLHIGHGRGAAYGDSLARVLAASGYNVAREYYINDGGNQMNNLGLSVYARACELKGIDYPFPENGYHGDYIIDISKTVLESHPNLLQIEEDKAATICLGYAIKSISKYIEKDLRDFRVEFDNWFSEKTLYSSKAIEKVLEKLKVSGYTYESEGALWLATTKMGDDKDRVLKKASGEYTYFAPDIAYHEDKYSRGFERLIDVWGADHHGYIKRMTSAIVALGHEEESFEVSLIQMVNLIKEGEKISMSTRAGSFIPLSWLTEEVGLDATRFFYNMRSHDAQFDFDIDLAKSRSNENPVYYIQYAHARVYSLMSNAKEKGHKYIRGEGIEKLTSPEERNLIKEMMKLRYTIELAALHLEPHRLTYHLQEIAAAFHSYYYSNQIVSDADKELTNARLTLSEAVAKTIKYGLDLLGVSAPERM